MKKIVVLVVFVFVLTTGFLDAESSDSSLGKSGSGPEGTTTGEKSNRKPEPYGEKEFPQWLKDLRRGEIVFFGSIPFTLFFSFESYDLYRYFSNDMNPGYSPWPFRGYNAIPYTDSEKLGVLLGALSFSLGIAVTDYLLGILSKGEEWEN